MIFSAGKWDNASEIKRFIPLSNSISFDKMMASLSNAYGLFIIPLLGDKMTGKLEEIYLSGGTGKPDGNQNSLSDDEKADIKLLQLCQQANANLAIWYDFDELNTRITDSGFQRQESENGTFKSVYKYQDENLRRNFKNKGFNALDKVLDFLYDHLERYADFKESDTYKQGINAIVKSTQEVNKVYFINNSRIIFLRLSTHLSFAEENILMPAIGERLYAQLLAWLNKMPEDELLCSQVNELRLKCGKVIIMNAVKRLMMETGSLTDRGLYFHSIQANQHGERNEEPVDGNSLSMQLSQAESDIQAFTKNLMSFIRNTFPDYYKGDPLRVFDRENDNKTTFWA